MTLVQFFSFFLGLSLALGIGALLRIVIGMRLNLFLVNHDSFVTDQAIIPVTTELKKASLFNVLFKGNWKEDVELTLSDDAENSFTFNFGFEIWKRFHLTLKNQEGDLASVTLNSEKILPMQKVYLRTGYELKIGDRAFTVIVTPELLALPGERDFAHDYSKENT